MLNNKISSTLYIRSTEALNIAGKDELTKKTNRDTYMMKKNVNEILNFNIFWVLYAHGENGCELLANILYRIKTDL